MLRLSIIGLGFGINLYEAADVSKDGLMLTIVTIAATLSIGLIAGRLLLINKNITILISTGTAICGGSAIAALSPIIDAKEEEMTIALGTIFLLNAAALFLFPLIGSALALGQEQFGLWAAIAIHDTSSVIGAAQIYGDTALRIATTVKLERALWIVPLSLSVALIQGKNKAVKFPYFILFFVVAMALNTFFSEIQQLATWIVPYSKKGMTLVLFMIGSGLSLTTIKKVGPKPMLLGVGLWIIIAVGSLLFLMYY